MPLFIFLASIALFLSSCIPAFQVDEKMHRLEKRIQDLEEYRNREIKKMKKDVEELLEDNKKMKSEIKELMLRTSITGEPITEEKIEDSESPSDE